MADEPSLHIDTDWKKQAQEEKRKLAEAQEKQRAAAASSSTAAAGGSPAAAQPSARGGARRGAREVPQASFAALVQSLLTQALLYLGEIAMQGSEPLLDFDRAKYQLDLLSILEDKTRNNLDEADQRLLDSALYDLRSRYINIASQYI